MPTPDVVGANGPRPKKKAGRNRRTVTNLNSKRGYAASPRERAFWGRQDSMGRSLGQLGAFKSFVSAPGGQTKGNGGGGNSDGVLAALAALRAQGQGVGAGLGGGGFSPEQTGPKTAVDRRNEARGEVPTSQYVQEGMAPQPTFDTPERMEMIERLREVGGNRGVTPPTAPTPSFNRFQMFTPTRPKARGKGKR